MAESNKQIAFEFLNGPHKGKVFPVQVGMVLGRSQGDIVLRDKKASTRHAEVQERSEGLFLVDLISQNGLWLGREKKKEILLSPGAEIRIAQTQIRVVAISSQKTEALKNLKAEIRRSADLPQTAIAKVHPFNPPLELLFRQGPQAGESVVLGFGPRRVGSQVLDLELQDPSAPPLAFELRANATGVEVHSLNPDGVLLNGERVRNHQLREGDLIQVGQTVMEVRPYVSEDVST